MKYNCKNNEEWRVLRSKSIGASAIGAILGESPFVTPMEMAERMKEELNGRFDFSETDSMENGHDYEGGIAAKWSRKTGHNIIKSSVGDVLYKRDDIPFMHASPDRVYWIDEDGPKHGKASETNKGVLECKLTWSRKPIDPANLPLSWQFQIQVQMGIMGMREGWIAYHAMAYPDGYGFVKFNFDEEIFNAAVEVCREFWNNSVIGDVIPEPVAPRDVIRQYPSPTPGSSLVADSDAICLISSINELEDKKAEIEKLLSENRQKVAMLFREEELLVAEDGTVLATYKARKGSRRVDSKLLKKNYPEVYDEVSSAGEDTRVLSIKNTR